MGHLVVGRRLGPADIVDGAGHARAAYGDDILVVVRPDNYVGLIAADLGADELEAYLRRIFPA